MHIPIHTISLSLSLSRSLSLCMSMYVYTGSGEPLGWAPYAFALLSSLFILHIFWFGLMSRALYKIIRGKVYVYVYVYIT